MDLFEYADSDDHEARISDEDPEPMAAPVDGDGPIGPTSQLSASGVAAPVDLRETVMNRSGFVGGSNS